jgi:hypothetical protein
MLKLLIVLVTVVLIGCTPSTSASQTPGAPDTSVIGHTRRVTTPGTNLWVQEVAYLTMRRAIQEKDDDTFARVVRTYEFFPVNPSHRVMVLKISGERAQVEVIEGPQAGRRGWIDAVKLQ